VCESYIREGYENESQHHNHVVKTAKRILNYTEAESREDLERAEHQDQQRGYQTAV